MLDMTTCDTAGCFRTGYSLRLCSKCLDGCLPETRGPVTILESMRADLLGGEDLSVTLQRLAHRQKPIPARR
jgi:hypothetical protein